MPRSNAMAARTICSRACRRAKSSTPPSAIPITRGSTLRSWQASLPKGKRIEAVSGPLERQRDALPHADTERDQCAFASGLFQLMHRGQREAGAAHAERMSERDGAAIGVHMRRVIGNTQQAQHRERLRGKSLVELDDFEIADLQL